MPLPFPLADQLAADQILTVPSHPRVQLRPVRRTRIAPACFLALFSSLLTGCGVGMGNVLRATPGAALSGTVHGGQQPVSSTKVYLYAASNTGYATASTSLLTTPGGYVTTDGSGNWTITGDYTCPAGAYVYVLALGGNPGLASGTNNARLALMAGLGACSALTSATQISIDEVTTVAAAYSLAAFMSSETSVATSATNATGLANAFANIPTLVDTVSGFPYSTTPAGNGTVPLAEINTLADVLVPCINSDGTGTRCSSLMSAANVSGSGGTPVDTIQAILNIAHNPGTNVGGVFGLIAANPPFQPTLTTQPNDWTLQVAYSGNLSQVGSLAVDASGNIYAANSTGSSLSEFSPNGTYLQSIAAPYLNRPQQIGIDTNGNIWVASRASGNYADNLAEFNSLGVLLSGVNGYTGGGLNTPRGLAIDPRGNIWVSGAGELSEFTFAGVPVSGAAGYTGGNLQAISLQMNFDALGNAWVVSSDGNAGGASFLSEFTPVSAALNAQGTYGGTFTTVASNTSLNVPYSVALDASNNVWVANVYGGGNGTGSLTEYNNAGVEGSPTQGYVDGGVYQPQNVVIDGMGFVYTAQDQVSVRTAAGVAVSPSTGYVTTSSDCCLASAIDSSGNYWTSGVNTLFQWVGFANPVVTPVAAAVTSGTIATRP